MDGTGAVQVEGVFGAGGKPSRRLTPHTNTPHEDHAQHGRRLDVKKLLGLYDYFEKENFTCTSSWQGKTEDIGPKPFALPVTFTTVKRVHCTSPVEGDTGRCASALFPGIMKPGVSDDEKTMVTVAETLITDTLYVEFASFANHPYAKKVYVRDSSSALETGNDTITTFVVWTGGRANVFLQEDPLSNTSAPNVGNNATLEKVHCRRKERRTRPSFNFAPFYPSYLGVETDDEDSSRNLRKWRMSPREGVNITNGAGFIMWDDYATRVPRKFQDLTLDLGYSTMSAFDDNLTAGEVASWFQTYLPGESIDSLSITPNNLDQVDCLNSTNVVAGYTPNTNSYALPDFDAVLGPAEFEENREELALYLAVTLEAESAIPPFPIEGDPSDALFPVSKDRYWKELIDTARDIESQFDEGEFGEDVLEDRRLFDVHEEETSQLEVTPIHEANRGMQMRRRLEYFKCYEKMTCPCGAARSLFTRTTHNWGTCMQISSLSDLPGQLSSYAELLEHDDKLLKVKQDTKASTTGSKKKVDIMPPDFKLMVKIGKNGEFLVDATACKDAFEAFPLLKAPGFKVFNKIRDKIMTLDVCVNGMIRATYPQPEEQCNIYTVEGTKSKLSFKLAGGVALTDYFSIFGIGRLNASMGIEAYSDVTSRCLKRRYEACEEYPKTYKHTDTTKCGCTRWVEAYYDPPPSKSASSWCHARWNKHCTGDWWAEKRWKNKRKWKRRLDSCKDHCITVG